ncbi:MAG: hypothetical protein ACJAYC_002549 [Halieaceae bacterium]|jgi:hypothetical protein
MQLFCDQVACEPNLMARVFLYLALLLVSSISAADTFVTVESNPFHESILILDQSADSEDANSTDLEDCLYRSTTPSLQPAGTIAVCKSLAHNLLADRCKLQPIRAPPSLLT